MDELSELYAACIVEFAARQPNGILAGDSAGFVKDARDAFNLPYDEALFRQAIGLLERIGVLTKYERANVPTHYSVRKSAFDNSMIVEGSGARRFESLTSTTASAAFTSSVMFGSGQRRSPTLLESYADLGSDYLTQVLEAFEPKLAQIKTPEIVKHDKMSPTQIKFGPSDIVLRPVPELIAEPIESGAWTGLPSNFMLTQEIQAQLVRDLDRAESALATSTISQDERSQARAYIIAMRVLAEAPEPPVELIWELVGKANQLAGVASLFVSIIALFAAVAT